MVYMLFISGRERNSFEYKAETSFRLPWVRINYNGHAQGYHLFYFGYIKFMCGVVMSGRWNSNEWIDAHVLGDTCAGTTHLVQLLGVLQLLVKYAVKCTDTIVALYFTPSALPIVHEILGYKVWWYLGSHTGINRIWALESCPPCSRVIQKFIGECLVIHCLYGGLDGSQSNKYPRWATTDEQPHLLWKLKQIRSAYIGQFFWSSGKYWRLPTVAYTDERSYYLSILRAVQCIAKLWGILTAGSWGHQILVKNPSDFLGEYTIHLTIAKNEGMGIQRLHETDDNGAMTPK